MKTFHVSQLREHIDEFVRLVRENEEAIDLINDAGVIAILIPARKKRYDTSARPHLEPEEAGQSSAHGSPS